MRYHAKQYGWQLLFICLVGVSSVAWAHEPPSASSEVSREMLTVFAQVDQAATQLTTEQHLKSLNAFVAELRRKRERYRSETRFLSFFFHKVHRKFLKRYRGHTTLHELLEQGNYDCVTGTALYALLLDALDIPYQVHEFPYHVYLTLTTSEGKTMMIESTDPRYGLVTNPDEQAQRAKHYGQVAAPASAEEYQYGFTIRERIGLTQLAGLSYFNEAVDYYNQRKFQRANTLLREASLLYDSPRMEAFVRLMSGLAHR